ncbi:hypothetical protein CH375_11455 [Leptospira ellisii]|nr:hypothetical protein CH375_11455 [Leptospira ellisii]
MSLWGFGSRVKIDFLGKVSWELLQIHKYLRKNLFRPLSNTFKFYFFRRFYYPFGLFPYD